VLAPCRAGVGHDELDLVQVFQILVHDFCYVCIRCRREISFCIF
jgi:hypothetical protein